MMRKMKKFFIIFMGERDFTQFFSSFLLNSSVVHEKMVFVVDENTERDLSHKNQQQQQHNSASNKDEK